MSESGTVVIVAPMNLEYRAMRAQLTELRQEWDSRGTAFEVGSVPGVPWQVALMVTGEGTLPAAVLAERAIARYRPWALLVVGVAGGLKDDINPGDVVVATWVYSYHGGKEDAGGFRARPRAWASTHWLVQAARMVEIKGTWTELLSGRAAAVHFKPIAAGDVVLNSRDTPLAQQLKQHYDDAAAIEMESAGSAAAAQLDGSVSVITIRGISDKADGNKHHDDAAGLQPLAASHAAAFAATLLRELAAVNLNVPDGSAAPGAANAPETATHPTREMPGPGVAWRPLAEPLPAMWLPELGALGTRGSAILEIHLVPVERGTLTEARRLLALRDELATLGWEEGLFGPAERVSAGEPATVASVTGKGLAVTGGGQRSAWQPLPKDTLGAVLEPVDVLARLTALMSVLVRIRMPGSAEAGLATGVTPSIMVSEGRVSDLPRRLARQRTSMSPVRVPAAEALPYARIVSNPHDVAEELCARLFLAFRRQRPRPQARLK